jgi:hypothetical protein
MQFNKSWVYRNIHGYHILINMRNNNMLSISPILGVLFKELQLLNYELNFALEKWKEDNEIIDEEKMNSILKYFIDKGVILNE